jgi:hypothetical protein
MVIQQVVTEISGFWVQFRKVALTLVYRVHTSKFQDLRIIAEITCCAWVK